MSVIYLQGRSAYLDDMDVAEGDWVVCKCDIATKTFTAGRVYQVQAGGRLIDDTGVEVYPSARFRALPALDAAA